jgi:hypothetical protein
MLIRSIRGRVLPGGIAGPSLPEFAAGRKEAGVLLLVSKRKTRRKDLKPTTEIPNFPNFFGGVFQALKPGGRCPLAEPKGPVSA